LRARLDEGIDTVLGEALDEQIATRAIATGGAAAATWTIARMLPGGERRAATVALLTLVGAQIGQTLASGGQTRATRMASFGSAALMLGVVETPGVSHLFECRPLGPIGLGLALTGSIAGSWAASRGRDRITTFVDRVRRRDAESEKGRAHEDTPFEWPFTWIEFDGW
jgi:hypothetical protein